MNLSACSGLGTIAVQVLEGIASDRLSNTSAASSESSVITVDTVSPTLSTLTPATASVSVRPSAIGATFSEAMEAVGTSQFALNGTCPLGGPPVAKRHELSAGETLVATSPNLFGWETG